MMKNVNYSRYIKRLFKRITFLNVYFKPNNVSIHESSMTLSVAGISACFNKESTWSLIVTSTSLLTSIPLSSKIRMDSHLI